MPSPPLRPPRGRNVAWLGVVGGILLTVGGYAWLISRNDATICSSAAVTAAAPSSCTTWTAIHDGSLPMGVVGLVLVIVAVVKSV